MDGNNYLQQITTNDASETIIICSDTPREIPAVMQQDEAAPAAEEGAIGPREEDKNADTP